MSICQNPATGARTSNYYVEEVTCGITPASPVWLPFRYTSGNMQLTKDGLQSSELDGSREVADLRLGSNQTAGDIAVELSFGSYDDLLEAATGGTWSAGLAIVGVEITVTGATSTFTRTAGDFGADGVLDGMLIQFPDLVEGDNNKIWHVRNHSALSLQVCCIGNQTVVDEVATTTDYFTGDTLEIGSERRTFSVLTHFADADGGAGEYHITTGVEMSGFNFDVSVNALVTGSFPTIGRTYSADVALPAGSTFPPVIKTEPYASVDGTISSDYLVGGRGELAFVTGFSNTLDNAASAQFEIGSNDTSFIEQGRANSTLNVSTFFEDSVLLNRFINENETLLQVTVSGTDGAMSFEYQRCVFTSGAPDVSGEGSITQSLDAQALQGTSGQSSLIIHRLAL